MRHGRWYMRDNWRMSEKDKARMLEIAWVRMSLRDKVGTLERDDT